MATTILIIEDNEMNLDMANELLLLAGFQTLLAEDADTGIRLAQEHRPDLILMDLHLPGMNGYEACQVLKSDPQLAQTRIIGFTALSPLEAHQKALAVGCHDIISKPIDVDTFAQSIATYLPHPVSL